MRKSILKIVIIVVLVSSIFATSCNSSEEKTKYSNNNPIEVDTSAIAILPYHNSKHWIFKEAKPSELSNEDLINIELILTKCIANFNQKGKAGFEIEMKKHPELEYDLKKYIIDLQRYKRQYIAIINLKGQKEVWVNCFCNTRNKNWKKDIIFVNDGGNCFFKLKINLVTGQFYEFRVNGEA